MPERQRSRRRGVVLAGAIVLGIAAGAGVHAACAGTVLVRGNGDDPATLDIDRMTGQPELTIAIDLFEGLMTPDADGRPVPGVAESTTTSADGLTWRFTLRPDARWSDGSPVTAGDFVYAWRRLVNPTTGSDYAAFLWPVVNAERITKGQEDVSRLGVEAPDPHTLVVHLRAPTPYFAAALAHPATYPVPATLVARVGDGWIKPGVMVSNGPFVLAEDVPEDHIKLVRNPAFHAAGTVKLDGVLYLPIHDQDAEFNRFRAGAIDITNDVPNPQIASIRQRYRHELHIAPFFSTYFYDFNMTREPWRSALKLRQALSLAIDRDILVGKILQSGQIPAYTLVPPHTLAGPLDYRPQTPAIAARSQADRDALARTLFAEAGYGPNRPLKVEILYNTSENHKKLAIAIAAMWKQKLGVQVTLTNQEWKVFLDARRDHAFADLLRDGWAGDYNDANTFLELLRSDIGDLNHSGYHNPAYDALMRRAAAEAVPAIRRDQLEQAERMLLADQPIIPLYYYTTRHLVADGVTGWHDNVMDQHPSRFLSVAK